MFRSELIEREPSKIGDKVGIWLKNFAFLALAVSQCASGEMNVPEKPNKPTATQEQIASTRKPIQVCFESRGVPCNPEQIQQQLIDKCHRLFPEE
jgi:hypothetical protein